MTELEKRVLAVLIIKYQSQHDIQMSHLERTKMIEFAYHLLSDLLKDSLRELEKDSCKDLPF